MRPFSTFLSMHTSSNSACSLKMPTAGNELKRASSFLFLPPVIVVRGNTSRKRGIIRTVGGTGVGWSRTLLRSLWREGSVCEEDNN